MTPERLERGDGRLRRLAPERIEDQVVAVARRLAQGAGDRIDLAAQPDRGVRAERRRTLQPPLVARCGHHVAGAEQLRRLHADLPDDAARAEDQHGLALARADRAISSPSQAASPETPSATASAGSRPAGTG